MHAGGVEAANLTERGRSEARPEEGDAGAGFRRKISGASLGRAEQSWPEAEEFIVAGGGWGAGEE